MKGAITMLLLVCLLVAMPATAESYGAFDDRALLVNAYETKIVGQEEVVVNIFDYEMPGHMPEPGPDRVVLNTLIEAVLPKEIFIIDRDYWRRDYVRHA